MESKNIKIKVNAEGQKAIHELLDIALKNSGIQAFNGVAHVLQAIDVDDEHFEIEETKKT